MGSIPIPGSSNESLYLSDIVVFCTCLFFIILILVVDRSHLKQQIKKYEKKTGEYESQIKKYKQKVEDCEREISRLSKYLSKDVITIISEIGAEKWKKRIQGVRDAEVL